MQATSSRPVAAKGRPPVKGRKFLLLLGILFAVGAISTGHYLGGLQFPELEQKLFSGRALIAALVCMGLTAINLLLRWSRWHFLIRRFTPHLLTRDSLAVYLATLPAIMSPFFLAELGRVFLIRRRYQAPAAYLARVWFIERFLDFTVVASALLASISMNNAPIHAWSFESIMWRPGLLWGGAASFLVVAFSIFRFVLPGRRVQNAWIVAGAGIALTVVTWALPIVALDVTLVLLQSPVSFSQSVQTFAEGTLFGGLTGLPLGVFVTGSTMIERLIHAGVAEPTGVLAILVYRSGTAWFAVLLGMVCLVVFRRRLLSIARGKVQAHFDEIAAEYEEEIPAHVRERLLDKKMRLMQRTLASHSIGPGSRGLDLGCGQGWYLAEMRQAGYAVDGTDYSQGQLDKAQVHLAARRLDDGTLIQADAQALPLPSDGYDFVYSINAIHHMLADGAQSRVFTEIVRVLRPGGVFLLHEINTYNPVFRWYMGYLFPLLKKIDEGNEEWILPTALPEVKGARWANREIEYFTFLPDFVPAALLRLLAPVEQWLERSRLRRLSAHYQACLVKLPTETHD